MTKKSLLAAALLTVSSMVMAQSQKLFISSYSNTNIVQNDGQKKNVTMNRTMFNGWNTLCVPVNLSAEQLKEAFGADCKVECLAGVTVTGNTYTLNFQKVDAVKANTPYIVYFNGENKVVKIQADDAEVQYVAEPKQSFQVGGATISLNGATKQTQQAGIYGIYAKDNAEAKFVSVDEETSGVLATRCFITAEGAVDPVFVATHNMTKKSEEQKKGGSRMSAKAAQKSADAIYNINGVQLKTAGKGINIVNGTKFAK